MRIGFFPLPTTMAPENEPDVLSMPATSGVLVMSAAVQFCGCGLEKEHVISMDYPVSQFLWTEVARQGHEISDSPKVRSRRREYIRKEPFTIIVFP